MAKPFTAGDRVMFIDRKKRRYLATLEPGGEFHSHVGFVAHDDVIGIEEGSTVPSSRNASYVVYRPTLADFILKMPRGAQVIYPKDLGPMLFLADIEPGMHVVESGVGSGAMSMTLLRAGARVTGYELRADFAERARANVESFLGAEAAERYTIEIGDAYDGIDATDVDRVIFDLPEPWRAIPHAAKALRPGGIVVCYTPSITQAARVREAFDDHGFGMADTVEILQRGWHIDGQAVRPDHRMVGHTGFLTHGRSTGV